MRLEIEINSPANSNIKTVFNQYYISTNVNGFKPHINADHKQKMVNHFRQYLPSLKIGSGGSHIWISNQKNERLAIIYLFKS